MHSKISRFKLNILSGRGWLRFLAVGSLAVLAPFLMVPLLTQANFLDWQVKEVSVTFTEGTNMAAAPSPDGRALILAIQGSLWSVGSGGGEAKRLTGWQVEATWPVWAPDGSRIAF